MLRPSLHLPAPVADAVRLSRGTGSYSLQERIQAVILLETMSLR